MARNAFSVSIEVGRDGWCTGWVPDLPGLFVNLSSERAALRAFPAAIAAYLAWLARHGERVQAPAPSDVRIMVAERRHTRANLRWGNYAVLHEFERAPVTEEAVSRALRWMAIMRGDTHALLDLLPQGGLDWTRPRQQRTIAQHLLHVAAAERVYLVRLTRRHLGRVEPTRNPVERLRRVRMWVGSHLLRLTAEERGRVVKTPWGGWWSARKMLSRFLYHERYHLRSMARIARYHRLKVPAGLGGWDRY